MDDLRAIIAQIPDDLHDAFIRELEAAWGGLWLPMKGCRPGYQAMKDASDWAEQADPEGMELFMEHYAMGMLE